MQITPVVTQANGILSIRLQATFVGDPTDAQDKALIAAYGDPQISLVGNGTFANVPVPGSSPPAVFSFVFPCSQYYVGITTQMSSKTVKFMSALPSSPPVNNPNRHAPIQGELDCITPYPSAALEAWWTAMQAEITVALTALRNQSLVPSLPSVDI
jgi:hypothetical protein